MNGGSNNPHMFGGFEPETTGKWCGGYSSITRFNNSGRRSLRPSGSVVDQSDKDYNDHEKDGHVLLGTGIAVADSLDRLFSSVLCEL